MLNKNYGVCQESANDSRGLKSDLKVRGHIENSLDSLYEHILNSEKLTTEIVNSVQSDRPACVGECSERCLEPLEPTLQESINIASYRIEEMCKRLTLAKGIIKENLGEIKLY